MKKPTVDDVINAYFEALRPTPEEVQAMIDQWSVLAEAGKAGLHPEEEIKEMKS
ncbi:Uncharacterised protein [Pannonibacter phragmitetus]|uniref:Uncharacterized protein n=1 Tax=Pannonibacter phragmitetus TaxID=121719 RepID=A0A378ZYJ9_9HYPH|nr:hypothetical protein [Pannonibacter phragmitetus]SUB01919.1 Uncharacterised protein [Pannonibacter phragmitetus]